MLKRKPQAFESGSNEMADARHDLHILHHGKTFLAFLLLAISVPGPLGPLKFVPEEVLRSTDSIDDVSINICRESKNEIFLRGEYRQFGQNWPKLANFSNRFFSKVYASRKRVVSKNCLGNDFCVKIINWERIMNNYLF